MFNEHKEIVSKLKTEDKYFRNTFDKHNKLEDEVNNLERGDIEHIEHFKLEEMKKEKLKLKDELYQLVLKEKNK